jgi:hypothetical protein
MCSCTRVCYLREYVLLQDGEVKMIDFGFSKMFHGTEETHVALVTASGRPSADAPMRDQSTHESRRVNRL